MAKSKEREKEQLNVDLPSDLIQSLKLQAVIEKRYYYDLVQEAIEKYLASKEKKR